MRRLDDSKRAWELLALINPVNHSKTDEAVDIYKAEPYVVAADVYGVAPHTGRAGWTWYTGSAGWLYRLILESLLGVKRSADRLQIEPCMPEDWETYSLSYRYLNTVYRVVVVRTSLEGAPGIRTSLDGVELENGRIPLVDDQREHLVEVRVNRVPEGSRLAH